MVFLIPGKIEKLFPTRMTRLRNLLGGENKGTPSSSTVSRTTKGLPRATARRRQGRAAAPPTAATSVRCVPRRARAAAASGAAGGGCSARRACSARSAAWRAAAARAAGMRGARGAAHGARLCRKARWHTDFGQLAPRRLLSGPDHAPGCPRPRPTSTNQPLGRLWPATQALLSTLGAHRRPC
eukprot:scaffold76016_cov75-Phaeocystis_antarctica.AAC.11